MQVSIALTPPVGFILRQSGEFRRRLDDLNELWERLKPVMSAIEAEQFDTEGHGAWPGGPAYHGLVRTGALRGSLVDPGSAVLEQSARSMTWGTTVPYAHYHQDGGSIPGRPPQRMVIDVRAEDRQGKIEPEVVRWLNEVVAETWGAI